MFVRRFTGKACQGGIDAVDQRRGLSAGIGERDAVTAEDRFHMWHLRRWIAQDDRAVLTSLTDILGTGFDLLCHGQDMPQKDMLCRLPRKVKSPGTAAYRFFFHGMVKRFLFKRRDQFDVVPAQLRNVFFPVFPQKLFFQRECQGFLQDAAQFLFTGTAVRQIVRRNAVQGALAGKCEDLPDKYRIAEHGPVVFIFSGMRAQLLHQRQFCLQGIHRFLPQQELAQREQADAHDRTVFRLLCQQVEQRLFLIFFTDIGCHIYSCRSFHNYTWASCHPCEKREK